MEHTNEIALKVKNAEVLAKRNAEFLAKYDTDDKQIDYYTDLAMKLYDEFQIDGTFTEAGVRKNVATWYTNKMPKMVLLRKHPYWDEEAKAVIFLQTETREIDYNTAADALGALEDYVSNKCCKVHGREPSYAQYLSSFIRYTLNGMAEKEGQQTGLVTEEFIKYFNGCLNTETEIPDAVSKMLRVGTKVTRLVRKCFENIKLYGNNKIVDTTTFVDDGDDPRTRKSFDKYYAKFADCLSELKIERITLVSLNYLDFMTMSNGNSWSSCHFINSRGIFHEDADSSYRGEYKQGCMSYALDKPSMILYTLPATFNETDYYRCQKLTRMVCQYENGVLITGKCYPNNQNSYITRYRQMMQLVLSEVCETPNLWTFSRKINKINCFAETAQNSAHYPDYTYDHQKPTISFCKSVPIDIDMTITIGHEAYCLDCGKVLGSYDHKWLQCDNHRKVRVCSHCGKYIGRNEEYHEYADNCYCADCSFYCDYHQRYEPISYKHGEITMHDGKKTVCRSALDELTRCEDCGTYFKKDKHKKICDKCLENYDACECCGQLVKKDQLHLHKGKKHCDYCLRIAKSGFNITKKEEYEVGDYVLMRDDVRFCTYGANSNMQRYYPNKIVRIEERSKYSDAYFVTSLDSSDWGWSANCFAGAVANCKPEYVGKTLIEALGMIREENENEN